MLTQSYCPSVIFFFMRTDRLCNKERLKSLFQASYTRITALYCIRMLLTKQPKRLVDSNESLRRKNKYGMIRDEQDATVE